MLCDAGRTALHRAIEAHGELQPVDQSEPEERVAMETGGAVKQSATQNGRRAPIDSRLVILQLLLHGADISLPV